MIFRHSLTKLLSISTVLTFILPSTQAGLIAKDRTKTCKDEVQSSLSKSYNWSSSAALSLAQCLQQSVPQKNACVFYTSGNRDDAIDYAVEHDMNTIYDVYEPKWFNTSVDPAQTWLKNGHLRKVFQVTSRAYAMSCSGEATLVMPEDVEPCPTSIWVTDEYDAIQNKASKITHVLKASHVLVDGIWEWITSRIMSVDSASDAKRLTSRGLGRVVSVQRIFDNAKLLKENNMLAAANAFWDDGGDDKDFWAVHCNLGCTY